MLLLSRILPFLSAFPLLGLGFEEGEGLFPTFVRDSVTEWNFNHVAIVLRDISDAEMGEAFDLTSTRDVYWEVVLVEYQESIRQGNKGFVSGAFVTAKGPVSSNISGIVGQSRSCTWFFLPLAVTSDLNLRLDSQVFALKGLGRGKLQLDEIYAIKGGPLVKCF